MVIMRLLPMLVVTAPKVAPLFAQPADETSVATVQPCVGIGVSGIVVGTTVFLPEVPLVYGNSYRFEPADPLPAGPTVVPAWSPWSVTTMPYFS